MITSLSGKLISKSPALVVVENGGIGFEVHISLTTYEDLGGTGEEVRLYTHLHVREDLLQLYGFSSSEERTLFRLLISVSGVGPRVAQGVLSGFSVEEFKQAVLQNNVARLKSAPGIGQKTAERLALELKVRDVPSRGIPGEDSYVAGTAYEEAVLALVSLGHTRSRAEEAVKKASRDEPGLGIEELIRKSLRGM
jgi:holliday junction DNA helicase RuvA